MYRSSDGRALGFDHDTVPILRAEYIKKFELHEHGVNALIIRQVLDLPHIGQWN